ncbi:hypothetical protein Tco_0489371 [Tanacetum coccineum]
MQTQEGMVNMVKDKCDDGLVVKARRGTESKTQNESSKSRNDRRAEGANTNLSNETEQMHEVPTTAAYNMFANDKQLAEQPKFIDQGGVDQGLDKRLLLASVIENKTIESLNQTLESENDCPKKTIAKLQKDFSKLEAQSIAFEISLQHKTQENDSLKTLQKENKNFLASLQIKNAHLKQTYKDLFESIQSSRVETNQCNGVKIKFDMEKIKTQNIELEHQVASLIKENEHLKLVYKNFFDSIKKPRVQKENLRSMSEFAIDHILGKDDFSSSSIAESNISKIEKESGKNICKSAKSKFEAYFEKLENTKFVLERQLARKVDDSKAEKDQCLKEINHLRTQLENLKGKSVETKFDKPSILGNPPADKLLITSKLSNSRFTPKVVVQKDLSKPVTAQSLPRNEKDQLLKRITSLESKLASQDLRSFQKRIP